MSLKWTRMVAVALAFGALAGVARATTVYSDTVLVKGPEFATVIELSAATTPGNYRITATDLNWLGVPLQALSFGVFTAKAPIKTKVGAGTLDFFYAGTEKLFLQLYAKTAPSKSAGLVGLDVATVVPLPATLWLLLSALGAGGAWRSLRSRAAALFRRASHANVM